MKRTSAPQPAAPPEAQEPSLPAEPVTLTPESVIKSKTAAPLLPHDILEQGEDSYHAHHWGINE